MNPETVKRLSSRAVTANSRFMGVCRRKLDKKVIFFRTPEDVRKPDSDHVMKKKQQLFCPFCPVAALAGVISIHEIMPRFLRIIEIVFAHDP